MKRRKKIVDSTLDSNDFLIPYETKKSILALFLLTFGVIIALSIISYKRSDYTYIQNLELKDFFSLIDRNSDLSQSASKIKNWFGLIGAILANFFINDLFGYFSFSFVIILVYWGFLILFGISNLKQSIFYSILILSIGILFSSMIGILSNTLDSIAQNKELFGSIGFFLGSVMIKLIGSAGGLIVIFVMIFVFSTILLNINLKDLLTNFFLKTKLIFSTIGVWSRNLIKKGKVNQKSAIIFKEKKFDKENNFGKNLEDQNSTQKETKIEIIKDEIIKSENQTKTLEKPLSQSMAIRKTKSDTSNSSDLSKQEVDLTTSGGLQPWDNSLEYNLPSVDLLEIPIQIQNVNQSELTQKATMIKRKLNSFNVRVQEIKVTPGPVVTLYEVIPLPNVKVNTITSLQNDLALALKAKGIRLIAPMPGRGTIGVEIPNDSPEIVRVASVYGSQKFIQSAHQLPLAMGKTASGEIFIEDLTAMPHLLIAGATGSGKSVGINTIINSILFKLHPAKVKFVLIDPKRIELAMYKRLKKHYLATCPDINEEIVTSPDNAVTVLKSLEAEMEKRYDWLSKLDVRNIREFNEKLASGKIKEKDGVIFHPLPYIIVIVDEFADLMITAGKQIENSIARLAQMSRAAGIHLIFATQRPSVNVIRGSIKANFPARIAYKVSQRIDSLTILDQTGAEQLLGNGDMIFSNNDNLIRVQNAFISAQEINKILDFIESQEGFAFPYLLPSVKNNERGDSTGINGGEFDDLTVGAAYLVVRQKIATVTFLQRKLKIGYARAARIMDELEQMGIVGPFDGGKNRLVLVESEDQLEDILKAYGANL